jgi:hypothetical protein
VLHTLAAADAADADAADAVAAVVVADAPCLLQIMGVGYYKPLSQWSKGEYTGANQVSTCC